MDIQLLIGIAIGIGICLFLSVAYGAGAQAGRRDAEKRRVETIAALEEYTQRASGSDDSDVGKVVITPPLGSGTTITPREQSRGSGH